MTPKYFENRFPLKIAGQKSRKTFQFRDFPYLFFFSLMSVILFVYPGHSEISFYYRIKDTHIFVFQPLKLYFTFLVLS